MSLDNLPNYGPVTALCLTRASREAQLHRAIQNFQQQTYPDARLLILCDDPALADRVRQTAASWPEIEVFASAQLKPRDLLATGVAMARQRGGFLALWDDDDQFHAGRLRRQVAAVHVHGIPCFLSSAFYYFVDSGEIFVPDLETNMKGQPLLSRILPSSLVCRVDQVKDQHLVNTVGPAYTAQFASALQASYNSTRCHGECWWMMVGVYGDNTQGYESHRRLCMERGGPRGWLLERQEHLLRILQGFYFDAGNKIDVCGPDGVAYTLEDYSNWHGLPPAVPQPPEGVQMVNE